MSDFDAESNPLAALTDDLVDECQSESRIALPSHASSSKQARAAAAAASTTAAASLVQAPRFDKSSDAYWLDRAQRRAHQQPTTAAMADGSLTAAPAGPRRVRKPRPKKGTRASAFMHFLFDTFDLRDRNRRAKQAATEGHTEAANMAADSAAAPGPSPLFHVVDVAGGRGQLAFFLSAFHSIPVSVIDPATMDGVRRYSDRYHLQRVQHRRARENHSSSGNSGNSSNSTQTAGADDNTAEHASPAGAPSLAAAPSLTPSATDPIMLPNGVVLPVPWLPELSHFRCLFPDSIALSQHKQFARPVSRQCCESDEDDEPVHDDSAASTVVSTAPALSSMLSSALASTLSTASLLYGMHSDGATEALVDYALLHDIDFAVVPCCVFPDAAPHRRVRAAAKVESAAAGGAQTDSAASTAASSSSSAAEWVPVRSYAQFLDYLQAKHPEIRRVDLPFEGRNTCLYRRVATGAEKAQS